MNLIYPTFAVLAMSSGVLAKTTPDNQLIFNCLEQLVEAQRSWRQSTGAQDEYFGAIFGLPPSVSKKSKVEGVLISQIPIIKDDKLADGFVVVTKSSFSCHELPPAKILTDLDSDREFRKRQWPAFELAYPTKLLASAPLRLFLETNENNLRTPEDEKDDWDEGDRLVTYGGTERILRLKPDPCLEQDSPARRNVLEAIEKELRGYQSAMGWGFRSSLPDYDFENSAGLLSTPTPKEIRFARLEENMLAACKLVSDKDLRKTVAEVSQNIKKRLGPYLKKPRRK